MGTQPPGQGQRLAGEAAAGADVLSVPGPARLGTNVQQDVLGGAQCSQDSGMRLGGPADAATGTLGSVGRRQAGRSLLPLPAHPMGLGTWGQRAQLGLALQGRQHRPPLDTVAATTPH